MRQISFAENRFACFLLVLVIAVGVNFLRYDRIMASLGPVFGAFFIEYEEKTRHEDWREMIRKEQDSFVSRFFIDQKRTRINWGLYNFSLFPLHFFYNVLHLHGFNLWLATKLLYTCMGIGTALLVFLIADLFYGPFVALVSGTMMAFSPHVLARYNFSADVSQPYNSFLSLVVVYFFLLFVLRDKWAFAFLAGFVMGANFLFFHVDSFLIPISIFAYYAYRCFLEKSFVYIGHYFVLVLIALLAGTVLNEVHASYLNLSFNPFIDYLKTAVSWGPTASHSVHGIVLLDLSRLIENIADHVQGVFINGKTHDWHHGSSLPGIPMVYNYLISVLFVLGCVFFFLDKKREDVFLFVWFSAYFTIYSFLILVRQKNILGEIPPIFMIAAGSTPIICKALLDRLKEKHEGQLSASLLAVFPPTMPAGSYMFFRSLFSRIKNISEMNLIRFTLWFVIISTAASGSYVFFSYLPAKNFHASYGGEYLLYRYVSTKEYTGKTTIVFVSPDQSIRGNIAMRLLTGYLPRVLNMNDYGIPGISGLGSGDKEKLRNLDTLLRMGSDKIFYCFFYFNDHMWVTFSEDYYKNLLAEIHPEAIPFEIKGLDGEVVWRIFEVPGEFALPPGTIGGLLN